MTGQANAAAACGANMICEEARGRTRPGNRTSRMGRTTVRTAQSEPGLGPGLQSRPPVHGAFRPGRCPVRHDEGYRAPRELLREAGDPGASRISVTHYESTWWRRDDTAAPRSRGHHESVSNELRPIGGALSRQLTAARRPTPRHVLDARARGMRSDGTKGLKRPCVEAGAPPALTTLCDPLGRTVRGGPRRTFPRVTADQPAARQHWGPCNEQE